MTSPIAGFLEGLLGGVQTGYGLRSDIEGRKAARLDKQRQFANEDERLALERAAGLRAQVGLDLQGRQFQAEDEQRQWERSQPGPEAIVDVLDPSGKPIVGAVPRGGQVRPLGGAIPRPPAGGGAGGARTIGQLRREFNGFVKPYEGLAQAYRKIRGAAQDPSPAGDLSVIFGYMKLLDPTSVVRESEQATAQNARSVPESVRATYNKILTGERLTPEQRADFTRQSGNLIRSQQSALTSQVNRYRAIAEANDIDPEQVVYDPFEGVGDQNDGPSTDPGAEPGAEPGLTPAELYFQRHKARQ